MGVGGGLEALQLREVGRNQGQHSGMEVRGRNRAGKHIILCNVSI